VIVVALALLIPTASAFTFTRYSDSQCQNAMAPPQAGLNFSCVNVNSSFSYYWEDEFGPDNTTSIYGGTFSGRDCLGGNYLTRIYVSGRTCLSGEFYMFGGVNGPTNVTAYGMRTDDPVSSSTATTVSFSSTASSASLSHSLSCWWIVSVLLLIILTLSHSF